MSDKSKELATKAPVSGQMATMASILGDIAPKYEDKAFDDLASGGKWLARLQLFGGNSDAAKEGKIPMGSWGVVTSKDSITPLGNEVEALVVSWRPKALSMGDTIISNYNPNTDQFKEIAAKSDIQDSGCMFGPEFLLYIPSIKKYVTYMMGSKSSRREAPNLKAQIGKAATLKITLINAKKYKWHNPVVTACSTPLEMPSDLEELKRIATEFNNPTESTVEEVKKDEVGGNRAR